MIKTIILKRVVNNIEHKTTLKESAPMHFDIIDKLIDKCIRNNVECEKIESLFSDVIDKY